MLAIQNWMDWMVNFIHFWMFILSFCPSIEKPIKKHPFLDEFDAISQIIQKWNIIGRQ